MSINLQSTKDIYKINKSEICNSIENFSSNILELIDYETCPNCGEDYLIGIGCFECGNGILISGEYEFLPEIKNEIKKEGRKKIIKLDKKLNLEQVEYLNYPNKLDPKKSIIFLTIGDKKYKIGFTYEILESNNFESIDQEYYKIAQNLNITFVKIKNNRIYKKSYIHYFKELNEYILTEILNNSKLNNFLN